MDNEQPDHIDWEQLATSLDLIEVVEPGGWNEQGGNRVAREALERIIGPQQIVKAVEYYISMRPGFELARSVLRLIRPWSAMEHCRRIFESQAPIETRRGAVELLRSICDRRVLPWVHDFLADADPDIQFLGISAVVELSYAETLEEEDVASILDRARNHPNDRVRETANEVAQRLAEVTG